MRYLIKFCWCLAALALAATTHLSTRAAELPGDPVAGHALAKAWCANCHVLQDSESAVATGAPAFSAVAANPAVTPMSLRVFFQTPHQRMPDFHLSNSEIDDLSAYILSLRSL